MELSHKHSLYTHLTARQWEASCCPAEVEQDSFFFSYAQWIRRIVRTQINTVQSNPTHLKSLQGVRLLLEYITKKP